MIKRISDIVLKVRPVALTIEHRYYYEGPCRFGSGDALQPGFDRLIHAQIQAEFMGYLYQTVPEGVELLECLSVGRTDNWENKEEMWETIGRNMADADVAFFSSFIAVDDIIIEFSQRFKDIPIIVSPRAAFSPASLYAAIKARNPLREIYVPLDWTEAGELLAALRARKVIRNTNILLASRFNSDVSFSSVDTFINHDLVTEKLGVHFRHINVHELLDDMAPATEEGNHTTPGRKTWNITEEELAEAGRIADELIGGAESVHVDREYVINSVKAFIVVRKLMDEKDCNGFTVPCPDVCSTRRMNEMQFTFCLTHSLNMEDGIPSSCEFDANAVLSQQALMAVSGRRPYMGNTSPIIYEKGAFMPFFGLSEGKLEQLKEDPKNLYYMQHSVPHRCMNNPGEKGRYALRHFAYDQKWGAVMRYDFEQDKGKTVTLCRFSPDAGKMLVGRGTIVGGDGYDLDNCNGLVIFRVHDQQDFWKKQRFCGNHLAMVYGDYTRELSCLAEVLGVEELAAY